jgi:hypothetical protein
MILIEINSTNYIAIEIDPAWAVPKSGAGTKALLPGNPQCVA